MTAADDAVRGSSAEVLARDFSAWRAHFPTMRSASQWVESSPGGGFEGRLSRRVAGGVSVNVIRVRTRQHVVERTIEDVRRSPGALMLAAVQLSGTSELRTDRGVTLLSPGDHLALPWNRPSRWTFPNDFSLFVVQFPESHIGWVLSEPGIPIGQALPADRGIGPLLLPYARALSRNLDLLNGPVGARITRSLVEMIGTELLAGAPEDGPGGPGGLFGRAVAHIEAQLSDRALSVDSIAAAMFVSRRRLQATFERRGTTVTGWVRQRRLERAAEDLSDPALRDRSIAQIARARGFADPAHFAHAFRARFGRTPSRWRAGAGPAQPAAEGQMP